MEPVALERYFGGLINNDLVVFENIEYGNAILPNVRGLERTE